MELSYLFAAAKRFLWVVLIGILAGIGLGYFASANRTESFQAIAVLRVEAVRGGPLEGQLTGNYVENEALAVVSSDNAQRVADRLGRPVEDVQFDVRAEALNGVDAIDVIATRSTPGAAVEIVNLFAEEYVAGRIELNNELIDAELAIVNDQIEQIQLRLGEIEDEIARQPAEPTPTESLLFQQLLFERNSLNSELAADQTLRIDLETARTAVRDRVLEPATDAIVIGGGRTLLLVAGAIAGAVMGVVGAIFLAAASGSVVDVLQTEQNLGARVLGSMPRRRSLRNFTPIIAERRGRPIPLVDELCVWLEGELKQGSALTVAIVGTQMGAGATTVASAIASRSAERGHPTLLADGDATNPQVSNVLLNDKGRGLADVIHAPKASATEVDVFPLGRNLDAIGLGTDELRPSAGLSMGFALENLAAFGHEIVLIDCGDLLRTASSAALTRGADVVVVVSPLRQETVSNLASIRGVLDSMNGVVLGVSNAPRRSLWPVGRAVPAPAGSASAAGPAVAPVTRARVNETVVEDDLDVDPLAPGADVAAGASPDGSRWSRRG